MDKSVKVCRLTADFEACVGITLMSLTFLIDLRIIDIESKGYTYNGHKSCGMLSSVVMFVFSADIRPLVIMSLTSLINSRGLWSSINW
jgi:predicted ferric reductase